MTTTTDCGCDTLATATVDVAEPEEGLTVEPVEPGDEVAYWRGPIGMEDLATGDGRKILPNALRWDNLPIPLRWAPEDHGEHKGAVVVGLITGLERDENYRIIGEGTFDLGSDNGREAHRQVDKGLTPGISMDLDDIVIQEDEDPDSFTVMEGRIRAGTLVAIPAFEGAKIQVSDSISLAASAKDLIGFNWVDDVGGLPPYIKRIQKHLQEKGMDQSHAIATAVNVVKKMCSTGDVNFPGAQQVNAGSRAEACAAVADWEEKKVRAHANGAEVLTAGAAVFPAEWFDNPRLTGPTPLTVTSDGRVYGHVAAWDTCHIANPQGANVCTSPPRSRSNYSYFKTGAVSTTNGDMAVGRVTISTVHAGAKMSATDTMRHYENTGSVGAYVNAGEDAYGIWIAGAARPGTDHTALKAAPVSGDWRTIGGSLEMVGALGVNVPGFPIPRPEALVAGGQVLSLVASGMVPMDNSITARVSRRRRLRSLQARVRRAQAFQTVRRVRVSLAYNKDQWRVPKGNGEASGRFIDMPDLGALEGALQDMFDSPGMDDGKASAIGKTLDDAVGAVDRVKDSLHGMDGDGAVKAAAEADTHLSKLEQQLNDMADSVPEGIDISVVGDELTAARDSVDLVKNSDLSLLGDKGIDTPDSDIGGDSTAVPGDAPDLKGMSDKDLSDAGDNAKTAAEVKAVADEYKRRRTEVEKTGARPAGVPDDSAPAPDAPQADAPTVTQAADDLRNLEVDLQDMFESAGASDQQASDIGATLEDTYTALENGDFNEADTHLSKLEQQLQDLMDVSEPATAGNVGESLDKVRNTVDAAKADAPSADAPDSQAVSDKAAGAAKPDVMDAAKRQDYWNGFVKNADMTPEQETAARREFDKALDDGKTVQEALGAARDAQDVPKAPATGSAQQIAARDVSTKATDLDSTLIAAFENPGVSDEDIDTISTQWHGLLDKVDALTAGIDDGGYNADDLKAVQDQLQGVESSLMALADKPGLSDQEANQIGQALDDLFASVGALAVSLVGDMTPPPFASRKYVRQWLGRKGIRLDGRHSLI